MNAPSMNLPPSVAQARTQALTLWQGMAPRERTALGAGIAVLLLFFFWAVFIGPALRTLRAAPVELDRLETQLQQMQHLSLEAKRLGAIAAVPVSQAGEPLRIATARLGDKASIVVQGERATLSLSGVSSDALRDWIGEVRSAAHARTVDAQLTRTTQGVYTGVVVVTFGAGT